MTLAPSGLRKENGSHFSRSSLTGPPLRPHHPRLSRDGGARGVEKDGYRASAKDARFLVFPDNPLALGAPTQVGPDEERGATCVGASRFRRTDEALVTLPRTTRALSGPGCNSRRLHHSTRPSTARDSLMAFGHDAHQRILKNKDVLLQKESSNVSEDGSRVHLALFRGWLFSLRTALLGRVGGLPHRAADQKVRRNSVTRNPKRR